MNQKNYHVIIIGGGSSGMGAAYALKDKGYNVAVIEQQEKLGGTACNSWVDSWIEALIPPHIERIFQELPTESKSGNLEYAWLPKVYAESEESNGLWMKKDDLSAKYTYDLEGKVSLYTKHRFVRVLHKEENRICSIEIESFESKKKNVLYSSFFIDCSADGVLCRSANPTDDKDFYWGRDPRQRYNESAATKDVDSYKKFLNEPSLFFNIVENHDDNKLLNDCKTVYADYNPDGTIRTIHKPDYLAIDGYCSKGIGVVNPMTALGAGKIGFEVLDKGIDCSYSEFEKRIVEFWKFLKLSLQKAKDEGKNGVGAWDLGYLFWGYTGKHASYLGIRETYRIYCERMLNQNDLVRLIDSHKIGRFIAVGSHTVDFHITDGLNVDEINKLNGNKDKNVYPLIRPYGIPYECLIPCNLNNVLVASRCFGASQIALASARINMVMAQLGWVAGNAMLICLEGKLSDVRDIDISLLQSDDYTEFSSRVVKMHSKYNSRLKNELDLQKTV